MAIAPGLQHLAQALTGTFTNPAQALDNPAWFVHLRLWQRLTPLFCQDSVTLFLEQANVFKLENPYRQRLLRLQATTVLGEYLGQYYWLKDFGTWQGGGQAPERLQTLQETDALLLSGCQVAIAVTPLQPQAQQEWRAVAKLIPGGRCCFEYGAQMREVEVGFELEVRGEAVKFRSFDKGIDPQTRQGLWGALMGPYEFVKEI